MSSSVLEAEDLENVPLVRMEDVQPSRDRPPEISSVSDPETEIYETCIIDQIEFENECVVNNDDDDSNIGSMGSTKSDDIGEDSDSGELIVPEVLEPHEVPIEIPIEIENNIIIKSSQPSQWPTLEINPGGVIRNGDKVLDESSMDVSEGETTAGEMVYACGQCSKGFKYLFCLVEHVKWHTGQKKLLNKESEKLKVERTDCACLHGAAKNIIISNTKANKRKVPKRLKS